MRTMQLQIKSRVFTSFQHVLALWSRQGVSIMSLLRYGRGFAFMLFFITSSLFALSFILCPGAIVFLLMRKIRLYQRWNTFWLGLFMTFLAATLELMAGTKVVFHGDYVNPQERYIMLMNHRTELDWCYTWMLILRFGLLQRLKLVLKDVIRHIPIWGYVCQTCGYLFVRRNWQQDQGILARHCDHLKKTEFPLQILLYPEGTDFQGVGKAKSDAFAKANDLLEYNYVLHPRTTGFSYLVNHLNTHLDCVVDASVAYPKNLVYSVKDIFVGEFPEEVHFHMHRYPIESIPRDGKESSIWLKDLWAKKESRLEQFYRTGCFDLPEDASRTAKSIKENCSLEDINLIARHRLLYVSLFWTVFTIIMLYAIYTTWYVRWFLVLMSLTNVLIEHNLGGYLHLEHQLSQAT